jgi:hypothetical protein
MKDLLWAFVLRAGKGRIQLAFAPEYTAIRLVDFRTTTFASFRACRINLFGPLFITACAFTSCM